MIIDKTLEKVGLQRGQVLDLTLPPEPLLRMLGLSRARIWEAVVAVEPPLPDMNPSAFNAYKHELRGLRRDGKPYTTSKRDGIKHPEFAHLRSTNTREYHRLVMAKYRRLAKERMNTPND